MAQPMDIKLNKAQKPVTVKFEVFKDVPSTLEEYVRLGRLGRFKAAADLFSLSLAEHFLWFPVAAEHADILYRQGNFEELLQFLHQIFDQGEAAFLHEPDERRILSLYWSLAHFERRFRVFENSSSVSYLESAESAVSYVKDMKLNHLLESQVQILSLLLCMSKYRPQSYKEVFRELLLLGFERFCRNYVWASEDLIFAAQYQTEPSRSIADLVEDLRSYFENSDPPDTTLCLAHLSTAIALCETFPLCICQAPRDRESYLRVKAEAYSLQCVLKDSDNEFIGSRLDIRLALLQFDENVTSGIAATYHSLLLKRLLTGALKNEDMRLQREIRGRTAFLAGSSTQDRLDFENRYSGMFIGKYASYRDKGIAMTAGLQAAVLKSLFGEALEYLDALQGALLPDISVRGTLIDVIVTRMRLWRWGKSLGLTEPEQDENRLTSEYGEVELANKYRAATRLLEKIIETFRKPDSATASTPGSKPTGLKDKNIASEDDNVVNNLIQRMYQCPSTGRVRGSVSTLSWSKVAEIDALLGTINFNQSELERHFQKLRRQRQALASADVDTITGLDVKLVKTFGDILNLSAPRDGEMGEVVIHKTSEAVKRGDKLMDSMQTITRPGSKETYGGKSYASTFDPSLSRPKRHSGGKFNKASDMAISPGKFDTKDFESQELKRGSDRSESLRYFVSQPDEETR